MLIGILKFRGIIMLKKMVSVSKLAEAKIMLARFDAATARVIDEVRSYSPTTPVDGGMFEIDDLSPTAGGVHERLPGLVASPHEFEARAFATFRQHVRHGVYRQVLGGARALDYDAMNSEAVPQWHPEQRPFFEGCIAKWGCGQLASE